MLVRNRWWLMVVLVGLAMGAVQPAGAQPKGKGGAEKPKVEDANTRPWVDLLAGNDLAKHWTTNGNWSVGADGVLALAASTGTPHFKNFLWSRQQYRDFDAEFEFKVGKTDSRTPYRGHGEVSAFLVHVADQISWNRHGINIRISDDSSVKDRGKLTGTVGGQLFLHEAPPAVKGACRPAGEWNSLRVSVRDNNVTVILNGQKINDVPRSHKALADRRFSGSIGFVNWEAPLWLRNIRIRDQEDHLEISLKPGLTAGRSLSGSAAVSRDGKRLLVADQEEYRLYDLGSGELKRAWKLTSSSDRVAPRKNFRLILSADGKTAAFTSPLALLDLETGGYRLLGYPGFIESMEFSSDGERLMCLTYNSALIFDVKTPKLTHIAPAGGGGNEFASARLSPDGKQICVTSKQGKAEVFDVGPTGFPAILKPRFALEDWPGPAAVWVSWTKDGRIVCFEQERNSWSGTFHFWEADGKRIRKSKTEYETITINAVGPLSQADVDGQRLVLLKGPPSKRELIAVDPKTGKSEVRWQGTDAQVYWQLGNPRFLIGRKTQINQGELVLVDVDNQKRRMLETGEPQFAGWGPDSRVIAWSSNRNAAETGGNNWAAGLTAGLDLVKMQYLSKEKVAGFKGYSPPKGWEIERPNVKFAGNVLVHEGQRIVTEVSGLRHIQVFDEPAGNPKVVGFGIGGIVCIDGKTGKTISALPLPGGPKGSPQPEFTPSPDGKFALVNFGSKRETFLYSLGREPKLVLTMYVSGTDWVAWTPQGYYAGTPGGERLIGVVKREDYYQPLSFYPIERFRKILYRPDLIKLVLEKGNVDEALKATDAATGVKSRAVQIDDLLPPRATLAVMQQDKHTVKVKVHATASGQDQPVTALRLLVDGRPLADGSAHSKFADAKAQADAEWTITLPPGKHQLTVLARCPDSSSVSNSIPVDVAEAAKRRALHVLAIGVNDYEDASLKLDFAAKDAQDLAAGFAKGATGELYHDVPTKVLTNAAASKAEILKHLAELRKSAGPSDLAVVFFAGHGVKDKDKFYLLPVEAKVGDLAKTSISGEELRKALGEFPCQVLLMLDACHSSGGVKNFRPAVDDITRNLTDDDCGVAVMCSAMAHEKALEKNGNGLFTRAVVQALDKAEGVPFDRYSRQLYVSDLYAYVLHEVRHHSGDRQHPFLSLPWVVESFPVAKFAGSTTPK